MKLQATTAAVAVALCAAALLLQAEEPVEQAPPRKSIESDAAFNRPYIVMTAPKVPDDPGDRRGAEKARKLFQDALNRAHADGYRFAGMNNLWIVLERPPVEEGVRRRIVLPAGGEQPGAKPAPAPQPPAEQAPKAAKPQ
jgi:hypothetical protein